MEKSQNTSTSVIIKQAEKETLSQQIPDEFAGFYDGISGQLIEPALHPKVLREIVKRSSILPQCTKAYRDNIAGHGLGVRYIEGFEPEEEGKNVESDEEWERLSEWIRIANMEKSIEQLVSEMVVDWCETGNAYLEYIDGEMPTIYRAAPENVRCTKAEDIEEIKYSTIDTKGQVKEYRQMKRTRRYAQKVGLKIAWFREFGSMKPPKNGSSELGSEIIHVRDNTDIHGIYGEPLWIGQLPNIMGDREADEFNQKYFEKGRFPSMMLTTMNGALTDESVEVIRGMKGLDSLGAILYLNAVGFPKEGLDSGGAEDVKIQMEKLTDMQNSDGLFLSYKEKVHELAHSSFRLSPIHTGKSSDYNRATADTAKRIVEEQVFIPLRKWIMAEIFNKRILPRMGIHRVELFLKNPIVIDHDEMEKGIRLASDMGVLTVRKAIPLIEKLLGIVIEIENFDEEYLDTPTIQLMNQGVMNSDEQDTIVEMAKRLKRKSKKVEKAKEGDDCYL